MNPNVYYNNVDSSVCVRYLILLSLFTKGWTVACPEEQIEVCLLRGLILPLGNRGGVQIFGHFRRLIRELKQWKFMKSKTPTESHPSQCA